MNWSDTRRLIKGDLERVVSEGGAKPALVYYITNASFKFLFWFRLGSFLKGRKGVWKIVFALVSIMYKHVEYKTGIQFFLGTKVGKGLFFPHFSGIVVRPDCIIGENVTILQGVTIGQKRGPNDGIAIIGDNVVLSAGCKVIGKVTIGKNSIIGANAVVTSDIPEGSIAVGIPAKVISKKGVDQIKYWNLLYSDE